MAIHKKVRHHTNQTADAAQPVFSYPASPDLANVIVEAWLNRPYTYPMPGGPPKLVPSKMRCWIETAMGTRPNALMRRLQRRSETH